MLLELHQAPARNWRVLYSGWDARNSVNGFEIPKQSVAIHHPRGNVKSIAFNHDLVTSVIDPNDMEADTEDYWKVDVWEVGVVENNSSGSCLWDADDQANGEEKRCFGVLSLTSKTCDPKRLTDGFYGKMSVAWDGENGEKEKLQPWLDPKGKTDKFMDGAYR